MRFIPFMLTIVSAQWNPNYVDDHDGMVHLFEWKFSDIAKECERFLGPMGFGGVQVSPVQENVIVSNRPWWERYQPVSYVIATRSGSVTTFENMSKRCNNAGVRIYVDVVLNHMTGGHDPCIGTGPSTCVSSEKRYDGVPYNSDHFNPTCLVNDYTDPENVRNCELVSLHDLNQTSTHVRERIIDLLNALIDYGVAGFRIDAAKHMWPEDLEVIYGSLGDLNPDYGFATGLRPFIFQEVSGNSAEAIGPADYTRLGAVTEFTHSEKIGNLFRGGDYLSRLVNWGTAWGLVESQYALVFVDNHDNQRGHAGDGNTLTYKDYRIYKMAVAFTLAHDYGIPRVMSSFAFDDTDAGPPSDDFGDIISPTFRCDLSCGNGWVCEHRWRQIYNMIGFRNVVKGTTLVNWWDNGGNQIAFSRGNSGFIAINGEQFDLKQTIHTCLPEGVYCDVITGSLARGTCTGKNVTIGSDGNGYIEILSDDEDGVLAIHLDVSQ